MRKQSESEDGGMRELREFFEVDEVGKHSRGKGCQLVATESWRTNEDENEGGKERDMKREREARLSRPSKTPDGREKRLLETREIGE